MFNFDEIALGWNLLIYGASVLTVWFSAVQLARLIDIISDRRGLGKAFSGFVFLAMATSFPELVTCAASARLGEPDMLGSNLAGSVCMQTAVLCILDLRYGRSALTAHAPTASNLMSGTVALLLVSIALVGFVTGDYPLLGHVGIFPVLLFATMLAGMRIMYLYQDTMNWKPHNLPEYKDGGIPASGSASAFKVYGSFLAFTVAVGIGGTLVTYTSEAIASDWDIGSGFAGAVFIAISTSLPELSASLQAVKMNRSSIAIGNIFGSNVLNMALMFAGDLFYTEGALFNHFTKITGFYIGLAAVLMGVYLIGMLARRDKTIMRLGTDSMVALVLYVAGLVFTWYIS